jgi:hypothetical protein
MIGCQKEVEREVRRCCSQYVTRHHFSFDFGGWVSLIDGFHLWCVPRLMFSNCMTSYNGCGQLAKFPNFWMCPITASCSTSRSHRYLIVLRLIGRDMVGAQTCNSERWTKVLTAVCFFSVFFCCWGPGVSKVRAPASLTGPGNSGQSRASFRRAY